MISTFPFTGVPEGAQKVAHTASAVTVKKFLRLHPVGVGVALDAIVVISSITFVEEIIVLFVSVAVALFLVVSLVLSTLESPTSAFARARSVFNVARVCTSGAHEPAVFL